MRIIIGFWIVLMSFFLFTGAYGEENKKWSETAELSYVDTRGNTRLKTLSAQNIFKYKFIDQLDAEWKVNAVYGESNGKRSAEKYLSEFRINYNYTKRFYGTFISRWYKDTFAGIDSEHMIGPAAGYKIFDGSKHFLLSEIGINYVRKEYTINKMEEYASGRSFTKYEYFFNDKNSFLQAIEYLHNFEDKNDYYVTSETAIKSVLNSYLSLKVSYLAKYRHRPIPSNLDNTDEILTVALILSF